MAAQKSKPRKRKIDCKRVQALALAGNSALLISKDQQVAPSTITRYLQSIGLDYHNLSDYKDNRADLKALLQHQADDKMHIILNTITTDSVRCMSDPAKKGYLDALNNISGTHYDKERLERGQSTTNIHQITDLIQRARAQEDSDIDV